MKYSEIVLGDTKKPNPFTLAFVTSPQGNFLIKGDSEIVNEYITKHFPISIVRSTWWKNKKSRGHWSGNSSAGYLFVEDDILRLKKNNTSDMFERMIKLLGIGIKARTRFIITDYQTFAFQYRNMPSKWLPEWSDAIRSNKPDVTGFDKEWKIKLVK